MTEEGARPRRLRRSTCDFEGATLVDYAVENRAQRSDVPIVLVHGIGVAGRYMAKLAPAMARVQPVHVLELAGFGDAPMPRRRISIERHAQHVAAHIEQAGLQGAVLVGHSMGSQVVARLAATRPELISAVVLVAPVVDPAAPRPLQQGVRLALDALGQSWLATRFVLADFLRTGPVWYLRSLPSMFRFDLVAVLPRIAVPALVIRGSADRVSDHRWSRRVADLLPHGRLEEIEGGHHNVVFSHPRELARLVLDHADPAGRR